MFSPVQLRGAVALAVLVCLSGIALAEPTGVAWRTDLDAAKIEAAKTNRLLLLHFYTQSCGPCKLLDKNVLSQSTVGSAVEQDYVPVKIDADKSLAIAHMFRIDRVPTEVVLTPQGNVVATLSTPDNPEGYTAQLANVARHFRQTTPGAGPESSVAVNSAYASLPARNSASGAASVPVGAGPQTQANSYMTAQSAAPQSQGNPYVVAPPSVSPTQTSAAATRNAATPFAANPNAGAAAAAMSGPPAAAATTALAANGATAMPTNAMPQSYRSLPSATAPTMGGAPAAASATGAGVSAAPATYPTTTPSTYGLAAAAPPQDAAVRPAQPALPPNSPPVAFDGCCPVTLKNQNKWAPGSTVFGAIHRGRTYLFAGDQERQQFLAAPDSYSPVFAGYDPVLLLDKQQSVPGTRKFGYRYGGAFYLFSSKETMDRFQGSPHTYAAGVRQAMAHVDGSAGDSIRR